MLTLLSLLLRLSVAWLENGRRVGDRLSSHFYQHFLSVFWARVLFFTSSLLPAPRLLSDAAEQTHEHIFFGAVAGMHCSLR